MSQSFFSSSHSQLKKYANYILEELEENFFYSRKEAIRQTPTIELSLFLSWLGRVLFSFAIPVFVTLSHLRLSSSIISAIVHIFSGITIAMFAFYSCWYHQTLLSLGTTSSAAWCSAWTSSPTKLSFFRPDCVPFCLLYIASSLA